MISSVYYMKHLWPDRQGMEENLDTTFAVTLYCVKWMAMKKIKMI